jgi:hypothetical protein
MPLEITIASQACTNTRGYGRADPLETSRIVRFKIPWQLPYGARISDCFGPFQAS